MKNLILTALVLISWSGVNAQINKGRKMFGFSLGYSQYKGENNTANSSSDVTKNASFSGNARYGVFISDHLMIGLVGIGNVSVYKQTSTATNAIVKTTNHSFSAGGGVFGRYYQMMGKSKFAFFGQLSATYSGGKQKGKYENGGFPSLSNSTTGTNSSLNIWVNPGLTYFINQTIAIETTIGFIGYTGQHSSYPNGGGPVDTKYSSFTVNLLQNFSLGLNFYFGKTTEPAPEKINP